MALSRLNGCSIGNHVEYFLYAFCFNRDFDIRRAKGLGIMAKVVGIPKRLISKYPREWRDCCRELMIEYQSYRAEETRSPYGWGKICKEISATIAEYNDEEPDFYLSDLRRQDFEHWVNGGTEPGDPKFSLIDQFIQMHLARPNSGFNKAKRRVIEHREAKQIDALHSLMIGDWVEKNEEHYQHFDKCLSKFFVLSGTTSSERVAIYFPNRNNGKYTVVLFSFDSSAETVDEVLNNSEIYFGYIIPISRFTGSHEQMMIEAKGTVFNRLTFRENGVLRQKFSSVFYNVDTNELALLPYRDRTNTFWQADWVYTKDSFGSSGAPYDDFIPYALGRVFVQLTNTILTKSQEDFLDSLQNEQLLW